MTETFVDGNALAGSLCEVFAVDLTGRSASAPAAVGAARWRSCGCTPALRGSSAAAWAATASCCASSPAPVAAGSTCGACPSSRFPPSADRRTARRIGSVRLGTNVTYGGLAGAGRRRGRKRARDRAPLGHGPASVGLLLFGGIALRRAAQAWYFHAAVRGAWAERFSGVSPWP